MEKGDLGENLREDIERLQSQRKQLKTHNERTELDTSIASLVKKYQKTTGQPYRAQAYQK